MVALLAGRAVGTAEGRGGFQDDGRRLSLRALDIGVRCRKRDEGFRVADDDVERLQVLECAVRGGWRRDGFSLGPWPFQALTQDVRDHRVFAGNRREVPFGESDHPHRAKPKTLRSSYAADVNGGIAEPSRGKADCVDCLFDDPEGVIAGQGSAGRIRRHSGHGFV